jgi:hypothetical protein
MTPDYNGVLGNFRPTTARAIDQWLRAPGGAVSPPAGARPQQVLRALTFSITELVNGATISHTVKELNGGYPCVVTGWWAQALDSGNAVVDLRLFTASLVVTTGTREIDQMPANLAFGTSAVNPYLLSGYDAPGVYAFWSGQETRNLVFTNNSGVDAALTVTFQMLTMGV